MGFSGGGAKNEMPISKNAPSSPPPAPPKSSNVATPTIAAKLFCSKCGKQIDVNSSFCYSCGSAVNAPPKPTPPPNPPVETKATTLSTTVETPKWTCKKCGHTENHMTVAECECGKHAEGKLLSVIRNWQSTQRQKMPEKYYFLCRTHGPKGGCPKCSGEFNNIGEKAYDGGEDFELIECKGCGFRLREVDHNVCSCPYCDKSCLIGMIVTTNPLLSRLTCKIENVKVCEKCTSLHEDTLSSCPECGFRPRHTD
jgi:hypothetical protein